MKQCQCLGIRSNGLLISDTFQIEHQLHDFYLNHIDIFFILASIDQCHRFDFSIQISFYILINLPISKVLRLLKSLEFFGHEDNWTLFYFAIFKISGVRLFSTSHFKNRHYFVRGANELAPTCSTVFFQIWCLEFWWICS